MPELFTVCPWCFRHNEVCSNPFGKEPDDGDLSLCWTCGQPSFFDSVPGRLRKPTPDETKELETSEKWIALATAWSLASKPSEMLAMLRRLDIDL